MYSDGSSKGLVLKEEGNKLFKSGDYQGAIDRYLKGIAVTPLPELWFNLGLAYEKLSQLSEAIDAYQQALLIRPDYPKAQCGLERMLSKKESELKETISQVKAKIGETRFTELMGALFRPPATDQLTPSGEVVTILDFPLPSYLYLNGKKMPLSQVEETIGKKFCNTLTIDKKYFAAYKKYCHEETVFQIFATQLKHPDPLPVDFFDIRDMGKFGYGLFLRGPVKAGTILTYYFGKIIPGNGSSDYSLRFGRPLAEYSTDLVVDLGPEMFTLGGLMQHLPDDDDLSNETIRFSADCKIATENVHRHSVHLVAEDGPLCSVIVTPLVAQRDLRPNEIIGFSYTKEYWESRYLRTLLTDSGTTKPVYFDPYGKVVEPVSSSDTPSTIPQRQAYSNNVLPRAFNDKTFSMLAEEAAPQLKGDSKIKAMQKYVEITHGYDQIVLKQHAFKP